MHVYSPHHECGQSFPVVVWEGHATSRHGRRNVRYRIVAFCDPQNALFDEHQLAVERHHVDAMGNAAWNQVGHTVPRGLLASLTTELWDKLHVEERALADLSPKGGPA